jgi:hypothetical protein
MKTRFRRTKWKVLTGLLIIAGFYLCLAPSGFAALLWEQSHEGVWGARVSYISTYGNKWSADDFQLDDPAYVTDLEWVGGRHTGTTPPAPDGFNINFYANYYDPIMGRYRPADTSLLSEYIAIADVTRSDSPVHAHYYIWSTALPTPFSASAGTIYWLSIQAVTDPGDRWWG